MQEVLWSEQVMLTGRSRISISGANNVFLFRADGAFQEYYFARHYYHARDPGAGLCRNDAATGVRMADEGGCGNGREDPSYCFLY